MRLLSLVLAAALVASPAAAQSGHGAHGATVSASGETTISVTPVDPAMQAAYADANASLPTFWALFARDKVVAETGMLKVAFAAKDDVNIEHMWVRDLERKANGEIWGTLDNAPARDVGYVKGERVRVDAGKIRDWQYARNGRIYGSFTTRALLSRLPKDAAADYRSVLSETPLEGNDI